MSDDEPLASKLAAVKGRTWFYRFELPDGSTTRSDLPDDIDRIHSTRREKLRRIIQDHVADAASCTALDLASHEGYFSVELAKHFSSVVGLELRDESLEGARLIVDALDVGNVAFRKVDLQRDTGLDLEPTDFVLAFGIFYHLENPVGALRLASSLTRKHILIETQVFPTEITGWLEDGSYRSQRKVEGVFALTVDYAARREGGSTDLALVPTLAGLLYLLREFGFDHLEVLAPLEDDYEQFTRRSRVVVYGRK